jgi:hypothetical protein
MEVLDEVFSSALVSGFSYRGTLPIYKSYIADIVPVFVRFGLSMSIGIFGIYTLL